VAARISHTTGDRARSAPGNRTEAQKESFMHTLVKTILTKLTVMVGLMVLVQGVIVMAQTTTFTYQGRLTDGGTAANGTYDMQFKLTDTAGVQIGSVITHSSVVVTNGVFTVALGYGTNFTGDDRMLEISIKPAGSGDPYTLLSPRQPITSAPYAYRAAVASNSEKLNGVVASQYVLTNDPRLTDPRPPAGGSNAYIQNGNAQQTANFNIVGNGKIQGDLNAGVVDVIHYFEIQGDRVLGKQLSSLFVGPHAGENSLLDSDFNTFVGTGAGQGMRDGKGNTFVGTEAGQQNNGSNNSFFGDFSAHKLSDGSRNSFFGSRTGLFTVDADNNSFFGNESGNKNLASDNSFFGASSGFANTTGTANSFFGKSAGTTNSTGSDSSFFGFQSGFLSTGATNSFFGSKSGQANTTGFANAFFGMGTGGLNTSGFNNAFFGRGAGSFNQAGNNNTIVGAFADVDSPNLSFATAIGANAKVTTSNTIVLGRSNGTDAVQVPGSLTLSTLGNGGLTSLCRNAVNQISSCSSSLRYKKDLAPFKRGLALLNSLKPITFNWRSDDSADLGFGAEDVAAVEPLLVTRNEMGQVEGVKYDRITAVLVNAVKEQQEQIKQQQQQIADLKKLVCARNRKRGVCK
jgi:hypothetical protein